MNPEVTLVITSFNRPDLLRKTIDSLYQHNCYKINEVIIVDDSGDKTMHKWLERHYSDCFLILNENNIGAYESIDKAYSFVRTHYVLHVEDDWLFTKSGFLWHSLEILESNHEIMQVNLSNDENIPIEPEVFKVGDTEYRIMGTDKDGFWHGFTCRPSVRSMAGYEKTKPWTQWSTKEDFLALREMKVGKEYFRLGYKAAVLNDYFCSHIGLGRRTWHPNT